MLLKVVEEPFQEHSKCSYINGAIHLQTNSGASNLVRPNCGTTYAQMLREYKIGREIYTNDLLWNANSHCNLFLLFGLGILGCY